MIPLRRLQSQSTTTIVVVAPTEKSFKDFFQHEVNRVLLKLELVTNCRTLILAIVKT